jgi:hypothetical protein
LIGSLLIIFTLGALSFTANFSQKEKNRQISQNSEVDPLPGWKTYNNPEYKFTIRYPKQWYLKEYGAYAADCVASDPNMQEASPSAVLIRFLSLNEAADIRDFEKIHKLKDNQTILEPLDVKSTLTKNKNFKIGNHEAVDYQIERNFSAPVGPAKEFSRVYEINKEGTVLKFSAYSQTLDQLIRFNDSTLSLIITSLSFN